MNPNQVPARARLLSTEGRAKGGERSENSWYVYTRFLGIVTTVCIAFATVLHQVKCEFAAEPTHWIAAVIIVSLCAAGLLVVRLQPNLTPKFFLILCGALALVSGSMPWIVVSCDTHGVYLAGLSVLFFALCWVRIHLSYDSSLARRRI